MSAPPRVAVVGGSVAGLATALFLAHRGVPSVVLEQDATPVPDAPTGAGAWHRRSTPQAAHSHAFLARSRSILAAEAPEVLDLLAAAGVREARLADPAVRPATIEGFVPMADDDRLVVLNARRATFEWALRRAAMAHPDVELRVGVAAAGVELDATGARARVLGVRTAGGDRSADLVPADVVVDAGGKRSSLHAVPAVRDVPCGIAYLTRFYRLRGRPGAEPTALNRGFTHGASFDRYSCLVFPADAGAFSVTFGILPEDRDLRGLLDTAAFDAAARSIPSIAPWVDPTVAEPTTGVALMSSLRNVLRPPAGDGDGTDGDPLGLHAVGDARCVTNPAHTRGCTLALASARALAAAVVEHPTDLAAQADVMAAWCHGELAEWVEDSIAQDAARLARWRPGVEPEPPRWTTPVTNGQAYLAAQRDPVAWRAFSRLQNAVAPPRAVLTDGDLGAAVARVEASGWRPPPAEAPSHDELVAIAVAAASP